MSNVREMVRPPPIPAVPANRVEAIRYLGIQKMKRSERLRALGWDFVGIARNVGVPVEVIKKLLEGK